MGRSSGSESEDGFLSTDSPLSNDGDGLSGMSNSGVVLKKGPWTSSEDAILVDYVKKHGEGNWNAVQKHSGLLRCGKSCRLRWANHLRPNLKKGAFTSEEERLIIELHAKIGNKWARMAAHLPGRTDNEIKNYWNTRIKRRHRAGLPLYPPDLCIYAQPENQTQLDSAGIYGDKGCHDIIQSSSYGTSDIMFDSFDVLPYAPEFSASFANVSKSNNGFGTPQFYSFVPQTSRCGQEPDETMSDYGRGATNEALAFDRTRNDSCVNKMSQLCFPYDMSNVIFSASKHFVGAQKLELPSLQYQETGLGPWDPAPESLDSIVQSPQLSSHCPSPGSSGLLQDLLYEAKALCKSENQSSSIFSYGDNMADSSPLKKEFKGYLDPSSPSGNSMGSIFNVCTPTGAMGSSLEDEMPLCHVKSEVFNQNWIMDAESEKNSKYLDCFRPDAILGSCYWFEQSVKQQSSANDSILLGDDFGSIELNNTSARAGLNSCSWNNMPPVCQMSDIH